MAVLSPLTMNDERELRLELYRTFLAARSFPADV